MLTSRAAWPVSGRTPAHASAISATSVLRLDAFMAANLQRIEAARSRTHLSKLGQSHALARTRGIASGRPSAATAAKVAPIRNAELAPLWSHTYPNRIDAGNAPS